MDWLLVKKVLIDVVGILTAGMFVYFGLQVKFSFGDGIYYPLAICLLVLGICFAYGRG